MSYFVSLRYLFMWYTELPQNSTTDSWIGMPVHISSGFPLVVQKPKVLRSCVDILACPPWHYSCHVQSCELTTSSTAFKKTQEMGMLFGGKKKMNYMRCYLVDGGKTSTCWIWLPPLLILANSKFSIPHLHLPNDSLFKEIGRKASAIW